METHLSQIWSIPRRWSALASFAEGVLRETSGSSWCQWEGQATYYDLVTDTRVALKPARSNLPTLGFEPIAARSP